MGRLELNWSGSVWAELLICGLCLFGRLVEVSPNSPKGPSSSNSPNLQRWAARLVRLSLSSNHFLPPAKCPFGHNWPSEQLGVLSSPLAAAPHCRAAQVELVSSQSLAVGRKQSRGRAPRTAVSTNLAASGEGRQLAGCHWAPLGAEGVSLLGATWSQLSSAQLGAPKAND